MTNGPAGDTSQDNNGQGGSETKTTSSGGKTYTAINPITGKKEKVDKETYDLWLQANQDVSNSQQQQGSSSTSYKNFSLTPKETAYTKLDRDMMSLYGRRATVREKAAFYRALNSAEKRYASSSYGKDGKSTSTDYAFSPDDFRFEFLINLSGNYIKEGKSLGGQAGDIYNNLKSYASDMGVTDSEKTILANTIKVVKGSSDENSLKNDMRKRAISLYGGLAERLNANPQLTVRDAASDYIQTMATMLDLNVNNISLRDTTLSKALNANKDGKPYTMNLNEFSTMIRNDARFDYSTMAKNEARDMAASFARAFGFGG